ncbi:MAG: capsid cement protein [Gemmatimonadota bacterium]
MAYEENRLTITLPVAADYSADQYRFVSVDSNGRALRGALNARAIGVLQNDPSALGMAGVVAVAGVSKVVAGGPVTAGAAVTTDAQGRAVAVTSIDAFEVGIALQAAAAAGELIPVLLMPAGVT